MTSKALPKPALATAVSVAAFLGISQLPDSDTFRTPKTYSGPYAAHVIKVTDSDTIKLAVHIWPDQVIKIGLRLNGVDTPEKYRPKCEAEKFKAMDATNYVRTIVPPGTPVLVTGVKLGKYAGRAVGTVTYQTPTGFDTIARALVRRKHGVPYDGGTKTKDWCAE